MVLFAFFVWLCHLPAMRMILVVIQSPLRLVMCNPFRSYLMPETEAGQHSIVIMIITLSGLWTCLLMHVSYLCSQGLTLLLFIWQWLHSVWNTMQCRTTDSQKLHNGFCRKWVSGFFTAMQPMHGRVVNHEPSNK